MMPLHSFPACSKLGKCRASAPLGAKVRPPRYVGRFAAATPLRSRSEKGQPSSDKLEQFGFKREMTRHYILGKLIGAGTFGTVYEATCRRTGRDFAVKTIHKRFTGQFLERNFVRRVHHEVDIYMHMGNSLNVAHLYDVYEDDSCVDLIMERCIGGDLWTRIRKGDYSEEDGARIIREVLRTVSQFHAQGVVLRDVKPENFLFATKDRDSHLKAIDFGIAQYCGPHDTLTERAGTPVYVAPEVLKMEYGQKADIWSTGILAYQLLTGRLPFIGDNGLLVSRLYMTKQIFSNKDVFRAILYADLDFTSKPWDEISRDAKDLVQILLTRDASRRPTAAEALSHPWFQALDVAQATPSLPSTKGNGTNGSSGSAEDNGATPAGQRSALLDTVVQRLQRFGTYGRLKQAALRGIANVAVSVADDVSMLEDIRSTFEVLDDKGDGRVPYSTFVDYLQSGGFELTETEKDVLISQMDVEQAGYIKYDEWLAAMLEWQQLQQCEQWEQWVEEAFAAFDVDGTGFISREGLSKMLCSGEQCAMPDTIAAALREADKDRDGGISFDEFLHLVHMSSSDCLSNFEGRRPRS